MVSVALTLYFARGHLGTVSLPMGKRLGADQGFRLANPQLLPLINRPRTAEYKDRSSNRRKPMDQIREENCPHEAVVRAARCTSCCETNGSLTPCVVAWLKDQVTRRSTVPLRIAEKRSGQRAA